MQTIYIGVEAAEVGDDERGKAVCADVVVAANLREAKQLLEGCTNGVMFRDDQRSIWKLAEGSTKPVCVTVANDSDSDGKRNWFVWEDR